MVEASAVQPKGKPVQASRRPSGPEQDLGIGGAVAFVHFPPCDQIKGFGAACEVELIIVGNSRIIHWMRLRHWEERKE